jgi:hypothetical protein
MMDYFKSHKIIFILLAVIISINYIITPLGQDQRGAMAFCYEADHHHGSFPANMVDTWLYRGIAYKYISFCLYKNAILISSYDNKISFELSVKLQLLLIIAAVLIFSYMNTRDYFKSKGIDSRIIYYWLFCVFTTLSYEASFQAEDMASLIAILGISFCINGKQVSVIVGIFILSLLFMLKGITITVGAAILFGLPLLMNKNILKTISLFAVFSIVLYLSIKHYVPQEIIDLGNGSILEGSFKWPILERITNVILPILPPSIFCSKYVWYLLLHAPLILFSSSMVFYYYYMNNYHDKTKRLNLLFITIFISILLLSILIQGKGFAYHYSVLIPLLYISFILVYKHASKWIYFNQAYLLIIFTSLILVSPLTACTRGYIKQVRNDEHVYKSLDLAYKFSLEKETLYISSGHYNYYLKSKSYLKYFFTAPFCAGRLHRNPDIINTKVYNDEMGKSLNYKGKYILITNVWIDLDILPDLKRKIQNEYTIELEVRNVSVPFTIYKRI